MFSLILTFCTLNTCEEYVTDHSVNSQDAYRSYLEQFKAEGLFDDDNGVVQ